MAENEKLYRQYQTEKLLKDQALLQNDIVSDMTRQYKSVEEEMLDQINKLQQRKLENTEKLK